MNITMPDSHSLHSFVGCNSGFLISADLSHYFFFFCMESQLHIRLVRIIIIILKLHCCSAIWGRISPGVELYKCEWNRLSGLILVFFTPLTQRKLEFLGTIIEQDFSKSLNNDLLLFS